jgi:hypothetical protein
MFLKVYAQPDNLKLDSDDGNQRSEGEKRDNLKKALQFYFRVYDTITIRKNPTKNEWHSLAALKPTKSFPRYYREGYPSRRLTDSLEHAFGDISQDAAVDYPAIFRQKVYFVEGG